MSNSANRETARLTLGFVGAAHCHTPWISKVLAARSDVRVKTVYDHQRPRAETIARVVGADVVSHPDAIWQDAEIAGVFVMSETNRHEADVLAACRAKKPVFVEKPLGIGDEDSFRMAAELERAGVPFATGYRTRSEGVFAFLREQIQRGAFGKVTRIRYITCHDGALRGGFSPDHAWMRDPKQAGGGTFLDLGTHALDALMWLMGEPVVAATSLTGKALAPPGKDVGEDYGEGLLEFASGAIGSLAGAGVDVAQPVRCVISGTEGHAHVVDQKLYFQSKHVTGADARSQWTQVPPDRPLVFDVFCNALIAGEDPGFITPAEAANVCAVQTALGAGAASKRWVEPRRWPLESAIRATG